MTINEWIKEYATQNDIDIPSGIGDVNAVLNWLQLQAMDNGGGSSDFSTAEVIIDGDLTDNGRIYVPVIFQMEGVDPYLDIAIWETGTYDVVLYQGSTGAYYVADNYLGVVVTGDIQYDAEGHAFVITGNGTITFS